MAVAFLLDEHVEPRVEHRLAAYGYDVEAVGSQGAPDHGEDDAVIGRYSLRSERVVVTYDDDFVTEMDASEFHSVVYSSR